MPHRHLTSAQRKVLENLYDARNAHLNSKATVLEIDSNQWRTIRSLEDLGLVQVNPLQDGLPSLSLTRAGLSLLQKLRLAETCES